MKYVSGRLILFLLFIFPLMNGCASKKVQIGHENATQLPKNEAKDYAVFAMMSSNVYLDKSRTHFPIEELGWVKVDLEGNVASGNSYTPTWIGKIFSNLQYDIWEHQNSNVTVIAFKGTDEKIDWLASNLAIGISISYKSAKKHVKKYMESHPDRKVIVTGHSLGGGLALSSSLWLGVDAYVFNSSPRVFDGLGDHKMEATRKAIYQENEVLSKVRSFWPKYIEVMNDKDIYQTAFNYNGVNGHRIDYLAEGILRCATNSPQLDEFARRIKPVKVTCDAQ